MTAPLLGFITRDKRSNRQWLAHHAAEASMRLRIALQPQLLSPGQKVLLTDLWKDPKVVADLGFPIQRFHQLSGSCVGAGGGNALLTLIAVQRCLAANPTKAFIPFWPYDYGKCRYEEGDRGQGEGALGSTFAMAVHKDGVLDAQTTNLPAFVHGDGFLLTRELELQWSDGGSSLVTQFDAAARVHPVGAIARCVNTNDIKQAILNGYPATFACSAYIGSASLQGEGANAAVIGKWDSPGGHQMSVHGFWENQTFGPLFWVQNNWGSDAYPADPAGGPACGCWVKEADVAQAFTLGSEVYAFSNLNWFPAQHNDLMAALEDVRGMNLGGTAV